MTEQIIVCAAVKFTNKYTNETFVMASVRHFDSITNELANQILSIDGAFFSVCNQEQGFLDNFGKFYNREESLKIATKAKQINTRRPKTSPKYLLFSEDLY